MRVSSEETLRRAAVARESGKSWMELTRAKGAIDVGLDFFSGAKMAGPRDRPGAGRARAKR